MGKKRLEKKIAQELWNDSVEYEQWIVRLRLQRIEKEVEMKKLKEERDIRCHCHVCTELWKS